LAGDATAAGAGSAIAATVDGGEKAERPHRRVALGSGRFGLPVVGALILLLAGGVLAAALITHFGSSSTPSGVAGGPRSTASPSPAASSTSTSTSSTTTASTSTSSTSTSSTTTVTTSTGARSSSSTSSSVLPVAAAPPVTTPPTGTSSGSLPPPVANGVISGSVINDANGNSVADPGEVGISGVLVT